MGTSMMYVRFGREWGPQSWATLYSIYHAWHLIIWLNENRTFFYLGPTLMPTEA